MKNRRSAADRLAWRYRVEIAASLVVRLLPYAIGFALGVVVSVILISNP